MLIVDETKYPKDGQYIIGVSGGPDSMSLLCTLKKQGYHLIACNVNYNTRDVSSYEQEMVISTCKQNNIPYEVISVNYTSKDKNFEGWARKVRYDFFSKVYKKYNADGLFIAHHQDDDIETYLLQKKRKNLVKTFGLADITYIKGMKVLRPFLNYSKEQLLLECKENNIPYSIDVTNNEPVCERNKIRLNLLKDEKKQILLDKEKANVELENEMHKIKPLLEKEEWSIEEIDKLSEVEKIRFLYEALVRVDSTLSSKLSRRRILEYYKALFTEKSNVCERVNTKINLYKSYDKFNIISNNGEDNYVYILDRPGTMNTKYFSFTMPVDTAFLKIYEDSYPLTIRNAHKNDVVTFGSIHKKVNRIMIDEKIPLYQRKSYPIILDKSGKVVYFPLYNSKQQKNIATKLCFVIK